MSDDRLPVALRCSPKWWQRAYEEKRAAAVTAAYQEFGLCDVYVQSWGLKVLTSVTAGQGHACEEVVAMQRRLNAAVEYACVDMPDTFLEMNQ